MVLAYWAFEFGSSPGTAHHRLGHQRGGLVLGAICAVFAAADLHTRPQPRAGRVVRRITTGFGAIALVAGLAGLAANSPKAVEILVVAMGFLWLTATLWHVQTIGSQA